MDNINPPEPKVVVDDTDGGMIEKIMASISASGLEAVIYVIEICGDDSMLDKEKKKQDEEFSNTFGGFGGAHEDAILMDNPVQ